MKELGDKQLKQTRFERNKIGKALRQSVPMSSHGQWAPAANRADPVRLLKEQDKDRGGKPDTHQIRPHACFPLYLLPRIGRLDGY